jgi:hypothetical protein
VGRGGDGTVVIVDLGRRWCRPSILGDLWVGGISEGSWPFGGVKRY